MKTPSAYLIELLKKNNIGVPGVTSLSLLIRIN